MVETLSQTSKWMEAEKNLEEADSEVYQSNKELKPKQNQLVNGINKVGKVIKVGKATGTENNRCWITLCNIDNKEEIMALPKMFRHGKLLKMLLSVIKQWTRGHLLPKG